MDDLVRRDLVGVVAIRLLNVVRVLGGRLVVVLGVGLGEVVRVAAGIGSDETSAGTEDGAGSGWLPHPRRRPIMRGYAPPFKSIRHKIFRPAQSWGAHIPTRQIDSPLVAEIRQLLSPVFILRNLLNPFIDRIRSCQGNCVKDRKAQTFI